jgi:pyrroloquinoline-quinone synthase
LAWNEGKLTRKQLALYSCEWGTFIRQISKGWKIAGEHKIAAEEMEHFKLWEKFADSICPQMICSRLKPSIQLLWTTENNFKRYASALGALYAFELQQPATAKSKLEGIRKHYKHVDDWQEPRLLAEKISALHEHEKAIANKACADQCIALWDALSGIMDEKMN